MSPIERLILAVSPAWAASRARARAVHRVYDAGKSGPRNKVPTGRHSGDGLVEAARDRPRAWARHLDENVDLVTGLLNTLSTQASAIQIEPQAMTRRGELDEELNGRLAEAWDTWTRDAEVTGGYTWSELTSLLARSWLRDGEVFVHHLELAPGVDYPGIPYQIQVLEADYLPYDNTHGLTVHGIERTSTGRPVTYHFWADHPGDTTAPAIGFANLLPVSAANISHLRRVQRFHQVRGITLLAPIIRRLDDLRDYEESERIAARMAAAVCAVITRQPGYESPTVNADTKEREFYLQAGMVFDDMLPGEGVDLVNPSRPNPQAGEWRAVQLRAVAAGAEANYSTLARDYNGTYSAQRQELVEHQFQVRRRLALPMVERALRPMYERFVRQAVLSGAMRTASADPATLSQAHFNVGSVPWIDMLKEVQAEAAAIDAGLKSRAQVIRERGGDPRRIQAEMDRDEFQPRAASTPEAPADDRSQSRA